MFFFGGIGQVFFEGKWAVHHGAVVFRGAKQDERRAAKFK